MFEANLLIGGKDVAANLGGDGGTFFRHDPVTGDIATRAAAASPEDARAAVRAAASALPDWRALAPTARRALLERAAGLVAENAGEFGRRIRAELGFPDTVIQRNIHVATATLREAAAITTQIRGEVLPTDRPECLSMAVREPRGVVLGIAPWNAPLALGVRAVAVALACGNTAILKGSEKSPATHRLIGDLFTKAGFPDGVLNVLNTSSELAPALTEALIADPDVRHVNFTGSTRVGRIVGELAARHLKPSLLELGGKAPVLVFEDADLDAAAGAVATAAFANQGQICMSTERVIVLESVADAFVSRLEARARRLRAGDPRNPENQLGALVERASSDNLVRLVDDALSRGASLVCGNAFDGPYAQPTVLDAMTPDMALYHEESFGPLVSIIRVASEAEAIAVANDSEYGLSAAVFTRDLGRALRVARAVRSGICHVNGATAQAEPHAPFGGVGASGYGRFGGMAEIAEFTELRWITLAEARDVYPF